METMLFPMKTLRVTQGYGVAYGGVPANTYSHKGGYALDLGGEDGGADWLYAPCDLVVRRIYGNYNAVWFESLEPVEGVGGTVIMLCLHMNAADKRALDIRPGKIFRKGEKCYREGKSGNVTGTHVHLELGRGPLRGTGWKKNGWGVWVIHDPLVPSEIFRLGEDVQVRDDGGYAWKRAAKAAEISAPQTGPALPQTLPGQTENAVIRADDRVRIREQCIITSGTKRWGPTYTGGRFRLWFSAYTVRSVQGDRAVLTVGGVTAAAVHIRDLEKIDEKKGENR